MLVETAHLTKRFGEFIALDRCSVQVRRGEVFGLLGPNGAGKSTLLRLLMGFLQPSSGTARIDGLDCYSDSVRVHERVSYLPGDAHVFDGMSGHEVLSFFAEVRPAGNYGRSLHLAEELDLDLEATVDFMSTGMRQKVALASVLAAETPLLILDEPTANLDPNVRRDVLRMVSEARAAGRTVIFSSHVLSEIEEVCDRVVILRRGELVHTQDMSRLRRQHRIRAVCPESPPDVPSELRESLRVAYDEATRRLTIDTADELSSLLGWLATLSLREVNIEPIGLRAVYDQFHKPTPVSPEAAGHRVEV